MTTAIETVSAADQRDVEKETDSTGTREQIRNASNGSTASRGVPEDLVDLTDPSLPLNWSKPKKYFNLIVPAILTFVV